MRSGMLLVAAEELVIGWRDHGGCVEFRSYYWSLQMMLM